MGKRVAIAVLLPAVLGCRSPAPPHVLPLETPPPANQTACMGGLVCEADATAQGWRLPRPCQLRSLGKRVQTCWMEGEDWPRVVEFFQSRYPHAVADGPLLRVSGQFQQPPKFRHDLAEPTPPLLLGHQRPRGVELVLLAGDPVDMAHAGTDTGFANPDSPRNTP